MRLNEAIEKINQELREGEPGNISRDERTGYVGYDPQFVIDAVNAFLGPERWKYQMIQTGTDDMKVEFVGELYIQLDDGSWLTHGPQWGGATGARDLTDARKAAVSDFIKKAFAWWGIGNRPYRGELSQGSAPSSRDEKDKDQLIESIYASLKRRFGDEAAGREAFHKYLRQQGRSAELKLYPAATLRKLLGIVRRWEAQAAAGADGDDAAVGGYE